MNEYKFLDIKVGLKASFDVRVDLTKMGKFFDISGDNNPLHLNDNYAKEKGFKSQVVYGLLTSSFYSTLVGVYLPGKYTILHGIAIQFSKPVYINDNLNIDGEVYYINEAYKQIEIKATITNQDGKKVSKATIKVGLME